MTRTSASVRVVWVATICTAFAALTSTLTDTACAQPSATKNGQPAAQQRLPLELVPANAAIVVAVRPAEIVKQEEFRGAAKLMAQILPFHVPNASAREIRDFLWITYGMQRQAVSRRLVYRFVDPKAKQLFVEGLEQQYSMSRDAAADGRQYFQDFDETTVVIDSLAVRAPLKNAPPRWAEAWQVRQDSPIVAALDVRACLKLGVVPHDQFQGDVPLVVLFSPLYFDVDWTVAGIELAGRPRLSAVLQSDEREVTHVRDSLQALSTVLQNALRVRERQRAARPVGEPTPLMTPFAKLEGELVKLLADSEFKVEGARVNVAMQSPLSTKELGALAVATQPALERSQAAARRAKDLNNLKQIVLAMLSYHDTYGRFPMAKNFIYRANGQRQTSKHPHSWRVAILPYMEETSLREHYHYDEPWDSEANMKVLENMPGLFRSAQDDPNSKNTSYFLFTGPGTLFPGQEGIKMSQVFDGASQTFLLVEAKRDVPWTKPEDFEYAADKPLPKLGGWAVGEFLAAMADGSVRRVSTDIDERSLRLLITIADGEVAPELPKPSDGR